ncbi:citrate/2-methylcitrate synthase [Ruminococcaceae bacterium OttesenSCG-928-O06]|nr:citrate/2-methylcitrate synthase [Ruminococcaceae bacterium OttesenSCG-928-O06]
MAKEPKEINYSEVTPQVRRLAKKSVAQPIPQKLYTQYKVNRGLRDLKGNGVLTGLTNISEVTAKKVVDGVEMPADGKLYYRGIDVEDIVRGFLSEGRFGFEETTYLLLFGELPNKPQLDEFKALLHTYCSLPPKFTRDIIMKAPSKDMMNALSRSTLMLYYYDDNADDISIPNVLRQCLQLIARFPLLAVYGYHAYNHYEKDQSLVIHQPDHSLSVAENILHILRPDQQYTELEARILDLSLVLHAEHGGGNNSSFTVHVVSSSGTDTYSAMAAALGSLKGPKHGGANIRVSRMMEDLKENVPNWNAGGNIHEDAVADYLQKLLDKQAFDKAGLIYGIGHAVYSLSDPRAVVFENFVQRLSAAKGREEEYNLYAAVARLAPQLIASERTMYKGVSANIDFYSGFVYDLLDLPMELYTPIFAISRISGWSAHRIEELSQSSRIIRPAYKSVLPRREYVPLQGRE